jgi:hypothetical protein
MPKLELSIKTDYLPSWGAWHGIRELVQNAKDAEVEQKTAMVVDWSKDHLRIENEGAILPHEALLFGHTTKAGNTELIGKFGEGLKLGVLALVRAGFPVKIRSGCEVWVPSIQKSEKFNANVLVFDITGGRKPEHRVCVEIGNITEETWEGMRWKFRFLGAKNDVEAVETSHGTLLVGEKLKGHVFVKGIYVHTDAKLEYGYDLKNVELDRDRKMVDQWDFRFRVRDILSEAAGKVPSLVQGLVAVLEKQGPDAQGFEHGGSACMPDKVAEAVAADFVSKHGPNAVPVKTLGESKDLDHLGKKGIVVSEALASVLALKMPSVEKVKEALREETKARYGWHELNDKEKASLSDAVFLIGNSGVLEFDLDNLDVVDFASEDLRGLYKDGRVIIARKLVENPDECLAVLIHETAHMNGGDGDKSHLATVERLWCGVVSYLRSKP